MMRRSTSRLVMVLGLLSTAIVQSVVEAAPASASPSVASVSVTVPSGGFVRGAATQVTVDVATNESATFALSATTAGYTMASNGACATNLPTALCSMSGGVVTVTSDPSGGSEEALTATITVNVVAPVDADLTSVEGTSGVSAPVSFQVTAAGTSGTSGSLSDSASTTLNTNPSTESELRLVTSTDKTFVNRGPASTVTYRAALTRVGKTNQATSAVVTLVPDAASGTSISGTNPQTVSFASGTTSRSADVVVAVPASSTVGTATYHFVVTWDPTGADGSPTDTETGDVVGFTVTAPNPSVGLSLQSSVPSGGTVNRSGVSPDTTSAITFTVTATNTAAAGAANAANVSVSLPVSTQLDVGSLVASQGTAGSSPGTVTVDFGTIAPGASATLTIPTTVAATATKIAGPNNDITVGPASGTFSPPAASSATSSTGLNYEIRPDADLALTRTPASQNGTVGTASAATFALTNNGPDPATGAVVTLSVTETSGGGTPTFVSPLPTGCTPFLGNNSVLECTATNPLASGSTYEITVNVSQNTAGTATITAHISTAAAENDSDATNNADVTSDIIFARPPATGDCSVTQLVFNSAWRHQQQQQVKVVGTNVGTTEARCRVTLTARRIKPTNGPDASRYPESYLVRVAPGGTFSVFFQVTPPLAGTYRVQACARAIDSQGARFDANATNDCRTTRRSAT